MTSFALKEYNENRIGDNSFRRFNKKYIDQNFQYTATKSMKEFIVLISLNPSSIFDIEDKEMTKFSMLASQESLIKDWENEDDNFWNNF